MSDPIIKTVDLCYKYGKFMAVNNLSVEIMGGEVVSLTGANGAGKTTFIKMLSGILTPYSGEMFIGTDKSYMSQSSALLANMTARENYNFYGVINGLSKAEIEEKFALSSDLLGLGQFHNKRVEELTSGWRQLLSFSIAIMRNPGVLLLDEPTAGVDTLTRGKIWGCIRRLSDCGTTVLVTSHYASESAMCHRNINIFRPEQC